jgi:integrase
MKQPRHSFNLESKANKNGERLIYFNLSYGFKGTSAMNNLRHIPMRLSTQWTIRDEYWDAAPYYRANQSYVRKFGKDINNILDKIERESYAQLSHYREQHEDNPEPFELKKLILEKLKRVKKDEINVRLIDFIKKVIERRTSLPTTSSEYWKLGTQKIYNTLIHHIEQYEERTGRVLVFEDMTEEIYWDYFKTINEIRKEEKGMWYTQTSIHKDYKHLKVIFKYAEDEGIEIGFKYNKRGLIIPPAKASYETYLTSEQLEKIIETDVNHSVALTHGRNYIILSSFTGLRISDMKELHTVEPEYTNYKSQTIHCFTTKIRKSRDNREELIVTIPILKPVKNILEANQGKFPLFPAETKIRKNVKQLLEFLEFNELVQIQNTYYLLDEPVLETKPQHKVFTAHDCRRTFITQLKDLGLRNDDIEPITHPKLKYSSIIDLYDKSPLISKTSRFIDELSKITSNIYHT